MTDSLSAPGRSTSIQDTKALFLVALHFPLQAGKARKLLICTVVPKGETPRDPCFPAVGVILGTNEHIYTCSVEVLADGPENQTHRFIVFYKYNPSRPCNQALKGLTSPIPWKGEVLVLKAGERGFATSISGIEETELAHRAVRNTGLSRRPLR
ncbi:hypothetical protein BJ138DRAFT_1165763 [Hygrophoropsis aurantiaca]|uniref:Uncharacterized protein n=1 Tax=Hygrophoropsis aurantiaca TaxID=72124 RepID=A0ACB7ZW62_9AGAM|nr:hypothetical protein BJ138DRAFT_1165763 [Hygrophoropsis aurantiaca]